MNENEIETIAKYDLPYGTAVILYLGHESAPGKYEATLVREDGERTSMYGLGFYDDVDDAVAAVERVRKDQEEKVRVETEKRRRLPRRRLGWEKYEGYPANEYRAPSIRPGYEVVVSLDYRRERGYFRNGRQKAEKIHRFGWVAYERAVDERYRPVPGTSRTIYNRIEPGRNFDDYRFAIRACEEDAAEYLAK